jgi:hypothetical protein
MVERWEAARCAHAALDPIQAELPEAMVMGSAVLFAAMVHRCMLDPHALYQMGLKVLQADMLGHKKTNDSLRSLQDFAGLRVMGEEGTTIS